MKNKDLILYIHGWNSYKDARKAVLLKNEINLTIQGLMCIPPIEDDPKYHFNQLQNLAQENGISKLSIGMSGDYKEALPFRPTYIRLGTILFGKRN